MIEFAMTLGFLLSFIFIGGLSSWEEHLPLSFFTDFQTAFILVSANRSEYVWPL
jgi:hypothetical protein